MSGTLLLAAAVALTPGCTLFGDVFSPEQPLAEVTVVGEINVDRATVDSLECSAGSTLFWGTARNTGDVDVEDVFIEIDALGSGNQVLGTYRVNVFSGEVTEATEETLQVAGTSLAVNESGSFSVCAGLSADSVAGTAYRTDFITVNQAE